MSDGSDPSDEALQELEWLAVDLARHAGDQVAGSLYRAVRIEYKAPLAESELPTPVSEVDVRIEGGLRERIRDRYPHHGILGEELAAENLGASYVWAIDPIDGTTNFLHRLPLIAASVACLHHGWPVVGAVWCSATHELRPGVFHAHAGGALRYDGIEMRARGIEESLQRHLMGSPGTATQMIEAGFDVRSTGSAAVECAFVAAGLLRGARLARLFPWDVAGGIALLAAAKRDVRVASGGEWVAFGGFEGPLPQWRRALLIGEPSAVAQLAEHAP